MINGTNTTIRPRRCTETELAKVGVVMIDETNIRLGCSNCGREWSPKVRQHGRLPRGYWLCPKGCNSSK